MNLSCGGFNRYKGVFLFAIVPCFRSPSFWVVADSVYVARTFPSMYVTTLCSLCAVHLNILENSVKGSRPKVRSLSLRYSTIEGNPYVCGHQIIIRRKLIYR